MKKRIMRIVCLALCALLLCSCSPAETPDAATPTTEPTPSRTPAATQEHVSAEERYSGTKEEVQYAKKHIKDYFELYCLLNPGADIEIEDYNFRTNDSGYIEVSCYGADIPDFEASGILPDCVKLKYSGLSAEIADSHPVPYIPEATTEFEDGLTITLDRVVYPLYPQYLSYTWSTTQEITYGYEYSLEKYIDGEWVWVPGHYAFLAIGLILNPGEPEQKVHSHESNCKLGEGLYRYTISRDYPVEFVVSADAEPLEPLTELYPRAERIRPYNVFYKHPLPENITNDIVSEYSSISWPKEAPTYSTEFGFDMTNERIAALLLADMHSYEPESGSYVSDHQRLTFENNGLTLVNDSHKARALKMFLPFSPTDLTPIEYQERGILKSESTNTSGQVYPLAKYSYLSTDVEALLRDLEGYYCYSVTRENPAFSSLNWNIQDTCKKLRESMGEEAYMAEYGWLDDVRFSKSDYPQYARAALKLPDVAQSVVTDKSSDAFSGAEFYYTSLDGACLDLVIKNMPTTVRDNGDSAPIIPPYDAAAALQPELEKLGEAVMVDVEFAYAYHYGDISTLHPTWIFTISHRSPLPSNGKIMLNDYSFLAVDALTGKFVN